MVWCDSEHVSDDLTTNWYMYWSRFYSLQNSTRPWVRRLAEETFYAGGVFPWDRHGCQWFGSSEGKREKAHSDCSSTHKMSQRYLAMLILNGTSSLTQIVFTAHSNNYQKDPEISVLFEDIYWTNLTSMWVDVQWNYSLIINWICIIVNIHV